MIELFGNTASRANRVQWALEELEVPYDFYQIDFAEGDSQSEFFLKLNPAGKVPVLRDGDLVITESAAICNYLGEKYPEKGLVPNSGTPERAHYDQWLFFVLTELEQPLWTAGKHKFAIPEAYRVPAIFPTTHWEFKRAARLLSQGLGEKPFILGDRFSMADIFITHTLIWAELFKFSIDHPHLPEYLARLRTRPALKRIKEKPKLTIPRS